MFNKIKQLFTQLSLFDKSNYYLIIIIGYFVFAFLIAFLLPPKPDSNYIEEDYIVNLIMSLPLIAAVFFIMLSFRKRLQKKVPYKTSIRTKIAIAFILIAIIPSLPIIIITSNIVNNTLNQLFSDKTIIALENSVKLTMDSINDNEHTLIQQLDGIRYDLSYGYTDISMLMKESYSKIFINTGINLFVATISQLSPLNNQLIPVAFHSSQKNIIEQILLYLKIADIDNSIRNARLSILNETYIVVFTRYQQYCIVLYRVIPHNLINAMQYFENAYNEYRKQEFLKSYFTTGVGVTLIIISISIIIIAVILSITLSQSITRPIMELVEAAYQISKGNFSIHLERSEKDEIALLFDSFNQMAAQLEHGRKMMYQTQKLQAWSEIARKLIHEIKNPLTPIRLSAERLYRRYEENHPDFPVIVKDATSTIIEEVNLLMNMLSEFSKFARLPEIKIKQENINTIIENCVAIYKGNDAITFKLDLNYSIPEIMCDKTLLRQALLNIIQNAIDARSTTITISTIYNDGTRTVNIIIKDNGIGMSNETVSKVFEPTFSTKESGMGLGLAIVEKIIIDHRGDISCKSVLGQGTEFIITLPVG